MAVAEEIRQNHKKASLEAQMQEMWFCSSEEGHAAKEVDNRRRLASEF